MADQAFTVWTEARHTAILSHLATDVIPTLRRIREEISVDADTGVVMGAITDGNSDPRMIEILRPYFDFVVNAESVGVSKPDRRVYTTAVQQLSKHPALYDIFYNRRKGGDADYDDGDYDNDKDSGVITDDMIIDLVGPWWVHIGDDFIKDVVAAKDMGMRTIWAQELVKDKFIQKEEGDDNDNEPTATTPTKKEERSVEEFMREIAKTPVVKMQLGADDYLAKFIEDDFVDAKVDFFPDIATTLIEWHTLGQQRMLLRQSSSTNADVTENASNFFTVTEPERPAPKPQPPAPEKSNDDNTQGDKGEAEKMKFCVFCGTKLIMAAKFCSNCGEKQPQL